MWRAQIDAFRDDFHLLVPDLPEQGQSSDVGPFTMLSAAEQVLDLIETHDSTPIHLVGVSEGAQTLLQLLAIAPRFADTAIISSALVRPLRGSRWVANPHVLALTYWLSVSALRNSDWWIRTNMHYAAGVPDTYFDDFRESFRTLSKSGFVNLMAANQTFRLPPGLEQVQTRVLAVCGHREYEAIRASTRDIAAAIPAAQAYEVLHKDKLSLAQEHNWNMTQPDLFNEMVSAFIASRPLPKELAPVVA